MSAGGEDFSIPGSGGGGHRIRLDEEATQRIEESKDPWVHRSAQMRCRSCVFYVPKKGAGVTTTQIGRCRRNAPTMRGFPAVFPNDWCGEHRLDEDKL